MMSDHLSDGQAVDGKRQGHWVTYYADGNKRSEGSYKDGKKHARWILYHSNGNKQSEAEFHEGKYVGHYVSYHKNGKRFREGDYAPIQGNSYDGRKEGVWYQYKNDGETVEVKITYRHGRVVRRDGVQNS